MNSRPELRRARILAAGFTIAAAASIGCAGGRFSLRAKNARYPISTSPALEGPRHERLLVGDGLQKVGQFTSTGTAVGFVYSATPWSVDISEDANTQIAAAQGEGLANLAVMNDGCAINWFFPLTILPIWPGCASVTVTGDIVRRDATAQAVVVAAP